MRIVENVVLGLDLGNGSIGWAMIEEDPVTLEKRIYSKISPGGVVTYALGSRVIDVPENAKTKELLNVVRRQKRMVRRVLARRAQRMRALRRLFFDAGLERAFDLDGLYHAKGKAQLSPWQLRAEGLTRLLTPEEFALALLHIAKHRGFRSNSKSGQKDDSEAGKVKQGLHDMAEKKEGSDAETIGAYLSTLPTRRNHPNYKGEASYGMTLMRSWQEEEAALLFERQRAFGNALAEESVQKRYASLAFDQRELKSVADMVGECAFIAGEKRAPAFAPTAELFRFLQKIVNIRIRRNGDTRALTLEQQKLAAGLFGASKKISWKTLRKALHLPEDAFFDELDYPLVKGGFDMKAESGDFVRRSGESCPGTIALRECLGRELFEELFNTCTDENDACPGWPIADRIAKIVSDNDGFAGMRADLEKLAVSDEIREKVMDSAKSGKFSAFRGTMNISVKAMRAIIPHLQEGLRYDEACEAAGFDHAKEKDVDLNGIRNPVVQHLMREVRRQVKAICHEFNLWPGRVHIELLRDTGKSARERNEIEQGIKKRTAEREACRKVLEEAWGRKPTGKELRCYELWRDQRETCAYAELIGTDSPVYRAAPNGHIPLDWLKDGQNYVQIDHILPRSRTFDNSYGNQCLCLAGANQKKLNRTPFEWIGQDNAEAWQRYSVWVSGLPIKPRKKRVFLLKDLSEEVAGRFHARSVTDSAYMARLAASWFRKEYARLLQNAPEEERLKRRVFSRSGRVTDFLRHVWGVQSIKKNEQGERVGDQHHALDAVIVACCTEGMLQKITQAFKRNETEALDEKLPAPWEHFRATLEALIDSVAVSRPERCQKTGALHEETLRSIVDGEEDGESIQFLYERTWLKDLKPEDLENIKNPERCKSLVEGLSKWLALDKKDRGEFLHPDTGLPVRHVKIRRGAFTSGVCLRRGSGTCQADNGEMARVDVYAKDGKFYLVPVYLKDIAGGSLPLKICKCNASEDNWPSVDDTYEFLFSLVKNSYVFLKKKNTVKEGYFSGMNRNTASIILSAAEDKKVLIKSIGVQTQEVFEKYRVDRLGRRHRILKEKDPRKP